MKLILIQQNWANICEPGARVTGIINLWAARATAPGPTISRVELITIKLIGSSRALAWPDRRLRLVQGSPIAKSFLVRA